MLACNNAPAGETLGKYVAIVGGLQSGTYSVTFFLDGEEIGADPLPAGTATHNDIREEAISVKSIFSPGKQLWQSLCTALLTCFKQNFPS